MKVDIEATAVCPSAQIKITGVDDFLGGRIVHVVRVIGMVIGVPNHHTFLRLLFPFLHFGPNSHPTNLSKPDEMVVEHRLVTV